MAWLAKEKRQKLALAVGAVPFLTAGIDAIGMGDTLFGAVNLAMAVLNLTAIRFLDRYSLQANILLAVLNAFVALLVAHNYDLAGKKGLPYAWLLISIAYLGAAGVMYFRAGRKIAQGAVKD